MLNNPKHIIATGRSSQEYAMEIEDKSEDLFNVLKNVCDPPSALSTLGW
jgi:hypothetical protein